MTYHQNSAHGEDGLQVAPLPGLEVMQQAPEVVAGSYQLYSNAGSEDTQNQKVYREINTIYGLKRRAFWLVLALMSLLVIGIAIGGGVGGAMAVKSSGSKAEDSNDMSSSKVAPTTTSSASMSETSPASSTINNNAIGISSSSSASPTATASTDCPSSNGTVYTPKINGNQPYSFLKLCSVRFQGQTNIAEATVSTFNDCIQLCANYNNWHGNDTCQSAVFTIPGYPDGNCWALTGKLNSTSIFSSTEQWALLVKQEGFFGLFFKTCGLRDGLDEISR